MMTDEQGYSDTDWAWVAGFLEARGMLRINENRPRLVIRFNHQQIMEFIGEMLEAKVRGPYQDNFPNRKRPGSPYWVIQIKTHAELERIYDHLYPYLSDRRVAEFEEALARGKPLRPAKRTEFSVDNCGVYPVPIASQGGYRRHIRRGEEPCRVCMESSRLYDRQYDERLAQERAAS